MRPRADTNASGHSSRIELAYFEGCPHVVRARVNLRGALRRLGWREEWTEWNTDRPDAPAHTRGLASPAVLFRGRPLLPVDTSLPVPRGSGAPQACRASGAPLVEEIFQALRAAV